MAPLAVHPAGGFAPGPRVLWRVVPQRQRGRRRV